MKVVCSANDAPVVKTQGSASEKAAAIAKHVSERVVHPRVVELISRVEGVSVAELRALANEAGLKHCSFIDQLAGKEPRR